MNENWKSVYINKNLDKNKLWVDLKFTFIYAN